MHKYLRRGLQATLLVGAGGVLFAAQASASESTNGSQSLLGGNQITAPVTAPVTVAGNAVSALGSNAVAHTASSAPSSGSTSGSPGSHQSTSGPQSIGGGNQVNAPVYAPVTVSGNAVAVGGSNAKTASGHTAPSGGSSSSSQDTSGRQSIGGGNQVNAPVYAPVTVSGNALAALGSNAKAVSNPAPVAGPGRAPGGVSQRTDGSQSILGGNQVSAPITAPVTVSGNALALLGSNAAANGGCGAALPGTPGTPGTPGGDGVPTGHGTPTSASPVVFVTAARAAQVVSSAPTAAPAPAMTLAHTGTVLGLLLWAVVVLLLVGGLLLAGRRLTRTVAG